MGEKLALETLYTPTLDVCKFEEVAPDTGKTNTHRMFPIVIVQFNNKHSCHNNKTRFLHSKVTSAGNSQLPVQSEKNERINWIISFYTLPSTCWILFHLSARILFNGRYKGQKMAKINARRNIKVPGGNYKQFRHFTWGKDKAILAGFKSIGYLSGEEDHQAMGDPGPNPTSLQVILDKSLSSLITICHILSSPAKEEEHTKTA